MGCEAGGEVGVGVGVAKMHEPVPKTRRKEGRQEEWNGGARAADDEVTHSPATPVNPEGGKKERRGGGGIGFQTKPQRDRAVCHCHTCTKQ